jgi:hypothetical protein
MLTSRYAAAASSSATQSAMASVSGASPGTTTVARADPTTAALLGKASFLSRIPDVAAAPSASASESSTTGNSAPPDTGFRSLYQASDQPQPISATVQRLWGAPDASGGSNATPPQPLDLFSDRKGAFSS